MPILKVTVWDKSEHKRKKVICASDISSLPEARRALAAVVSRFDTLEKIETNAAMIILDIVVAKPSKDFKSAEWQGKKPLTKEG